MHMTDFTSAHKAHYLQRCSAGMHANNVQKAMTSWPRGGATREGAIILARWKIFSLSENFHPNTSNLGLKIAILGEFRGKIEILSTHNVHCQKFAAKNCNFLPLLLFNPQSR